MLLNVSRCTLRERTLHLMLMQQPPRPCHAMPLRTTAISLRLAALAAQHNYGVQSIVLLRVCVAPRAWKLSLPFCRLPLSWQRDVTVGAVCLGQAGIAQEQVDPQLTWPT